MPRRTDYKLNEPEEAPASKMLKRLIKAGEHKQIIFGMVDEAHNKKRKCAKIGDEKGEMYWQGRADMGRLIQALAFDGLSFGLRSGKNAEMLSDSDDDLIDALTALRRTG